MDYSTKYYRWYICWTHRLDKAVCYSDLVQRSLDFCQARAKKWCFRVRECDDKWEVYMKFSMLEKCTLGYLTDLMKHNEIRSYEEINSIYPGQQSKFGSWSIPTSSKNPYEKMYASWHIAIDLKKPDYPWQEDVLRLIGTEPDDRTIVNIVNDKGGVGKSTLVKFLVYEDAACLVPIFGTVGQVNEYLAKNPHRVYILDLPRSKPAMSYFKDLSMILEQLKNGMITNVMYGGNKPKIFKSPHIIIFSNYRYPAELLSPDRLKEYILDSVQDHLIIEMDTLA
jgi:hypothetical protein